VVDDAVSGHTLGAETSPRSWRELEVELKGDGSPQLLDAVEQRLRDAGIRRSHTASKLARLLTERLGESGAPPKPSGTATAGDVVLAYLRKWVGELKLRDPQVRQDAPEAVHKMRTALRRLRSIMQVYGRVVDREHTRELTDELKWLAGVLAPARDLEVLRQRLDSAVAKLPAEDVVGPVASRLTRHFARQEAAARAKIYAVLDGQRYAELLDRLERLLEQPPLTRRASRPATSVLPRELGRAYKRFERRMRRVERAAEGPERDTALHEARKAAKRFRYGIDAARRVLGDPAKRFRKRLKKVQELLGDHQDAVVARPQLRELAMQAHLDGENGFTYGLLHGAQGRITDKAERDLPRAHDKLTKRKNRRWMS
jgi:CHAD domain-containing protein